MGLDLNQVLVGIATLGTSMGTAIGMQLANAMRRKTINETVETKTEPMRATDKNQEARIQALEAAVFRWRPRESPPAAPTPPAPPEPKP